MVFVLIIHSLVCILLVIAILMQSGRGGGLTESFAAAENMFGARTNEFMVRVTSVLAVIFVLTSLSLAHMATRRDQSIMERLMDKSKKPDMKINIPMGNQEIPLTEAPATVPAPDTLVPNTVEPAAVTQAAPAETPAAAVPVKTK